MWTQLSSMLTSVDTTGLVVFLLVFLLGYYYLTIPANLPPGPTPLPIVGNMFSMSGNIMEKLHQWHEKYGDMFTMRMGSKYTIFINSYKLVHESFVKQGDVFSGRPTHLYTLQQVIQKTGKGVIFTEGPVWKALRRVTLTTLRDFGVGKKSLEQRIQDEACALMDILDKGQGQPMTLKPLLSKFTANVICSIIFGNRFEYEDPVFIDLTRMVNRAIRQPVIFGPFNFISLTRFVPRFRKWEQLCSLLRDSLDLADDFGTILHELLDSVDTIDEHVGMIVKEHEKTYDPSNMRDFVDLYFKTRSENEDTHLYSAANMRRVILDLFGAGTETTAATLDWLILYLNAYPEVQKRCQQDIDKVIGQNRMATIEDRNNLPYLEAVITEILRVSTIVPLGVPHMAVRETNIGGYTIPANTMVVANICEIHMDPRTWSDPQVFRPERFLDEDGKFSPPKENFMPFSIGPRTCLGEVVARMELFILLTTLLQFFTFTMAEGHKPDLKGQMGVTFMAKAQPIITKRR